MKVRCLLVFFCLFVVVDFFRPLGTRSNFGIIAQNQNGTQMERKDRTQNGTFLFAIKFSSTICVLFGPSFCFLIFIAIFYRLAFPFILTI